MNTIKYIPTMQIQEYKNNNTKKKTQTKPNQARSKKQQKLNQPYVPSDVRLFAHHKDHYKLAHKWRKNEEKEQQRELRDKFNA
jgi:hypothetical protein